MEGILSSFDNVFILKLILSFFVGGGVIAFAILAAERFGTKISGIILGLPIASAIGLFFIGFTQNAQIASEAATVMPITLALGLIFIFTFGYTYDKFKLWGSLALGLVIFISLASAAVYFSFTNIFVNSLIHLIVVACIVILFRKNAKPGNAATKAGVRETIIRGIFGGLVISSAVIVAKVSGPYWGGMLTALPASYVSMIIITTRAHGIEFTRSIIRNVPLATIGTLIYYNIVNQLYPIHGIWIGTILGYAIAVLWVVFADRIKLLSA